MTTTFQFGHLMQPRLDCLVGSSWILLATANL